MLVPGSALLGLARIPLLPADPQDPSDGSALVAEGMFLASRDIQSPGEDGLRRAHTERAYQLRAQHRPTPQGVFAGVTTMEWTTGPAKLHLGAAHRPVSYPNPAWLHQVCDQALDDPEVLRGLRFTANPLTVGRGDRFEVERPGGDDTDPVRASVRATPATTLILRNCRHGASWQTVAAAIHRAWPSVPASTIDDTLRALTRDGLLYCDLTPDDVREQPLSHILKHLPTAHRLHSVLSRLHALLADADAHPPGAPDRAATLESARKVCDAITDVKRPIYVDTAVDAHIALPHALAEQATAAANVLWRTATSRDPLTRWYARFLDHYGVNRLVPLLEATDDITGLGTDTEPAAPRHDARRDAVITGLYAGAIAEGASEVILDDTTVDALSVRAERDRPPASAEIYARVLAASARDRDAGRYFLAITRTGQPAGSARGRFTTLLPAPAATGSDNGPMVAELAFAPRFHVGAALTSDTRNAGYRIRLGGHAGEDDLLLDELALASNGHRLLLWSTRHDRQVIPVHRNPIGHPLMPALAAWLCLLGQHPAPPLTGWSWGPVEHAPFLPRVRYGSTILAPARWRLPESLTTAATRSQWTTALETWRGTTTPAPPPIVVTDDDDRQIPLHLDRDDDAELLRRYVRRGLDTVSEPHGGSDTVQAAVPGPAGHHIVEVVVPLTNPETITAPAPPAPTTPTAEHGEILPGGEWLSLAIRAPQPTQDAILARLHHLAVEHRGRWDRWFWLRYHTEALGPQVRVRFHGDPETLGGQLLPEVHKLCTQLASERLCGGFVVEPYAPETTRYGGSAAITAAEQVFHRDAELVLALLGAYTDPATRLAAAAVSAAAIARIVADADLESLAPFRLDKPDRATFTRIRPAARQLDNGEHLEPLEACKARSHALHAYRELLPHNRTNDCASSLIHMHANRLLGDNRIERIARALAKDLLARESHD